MSARRSGKFGLSVFFVVLALMMWLGLAAVASAQPTIASVSSSTHPDETTYYPNTGPAFTWTVGDPGSGVSGYWYAWDKQPNLDSYTLANPSIIERFGDPVTTSTPGGLTNVGVGDLNGDGKQDVVVAEPNGKVDVMLGDGSGGFTLKSTVDTGQDETWAVVVADFNQDGKQDVAATTATTPNQAPYEIAVMLGDGLGNLGAPQLSPGRGGESIVSADFNNDGWPDLATANGVQVSVFKNSTHAAALFSTYTDVTPTTSGNAPSSVAVGKIDSDSNVDLVAVNPSSVAVLLGNGSGGFTRHTPDPATLNYYADSVAIADFDGDGNADVLVTYKDAVDGVTIFEGSGDGTFPGRHDIYNAYFGYGGMLASTVADFNNDGKPDLAVVAKPYNSGANYGLGVLLGHGDFTFANPDDYRLIPNATPPWPLIADDLTGDGQVDLLDGVSTNSTVDVYPNATLTPSCTTGLPDGLWYFHVRAVDRDGNWSDPVTRAVRVGAGPILAAAGSTSLDGTDWSTTLDPMFTWTPDDPLTTGYSWSFSTNPDASPGDSGMGLPLTSAVVHATEDGTWHFKVSAVDSSGHWGTAYEVDVPVDTTAPSLSLFDASTTWPGTSFLLADNATYSQGDQMFAAFDSQDDGSGPDWNALAATLTAPDNSVSDLSFEWAQYGEDEGPPLRAELDTSQPGTYTLTTTISDVAGNPTTRTVHYSVTSADTTPPSAISGLTSSSHPTQTGWYSNNLPAFAWDAASDPDPGSGLAGYVYMLDQTEGTTIDSSTTNTTTTDGTSVTFPATADGTWYFHVCAVDNAGNYGPTAQYTIRIDTTPPTMGLIYVNFPVHGDVGLNPPQWINENSASFYTDDDDTGLGESGIAGYSYLVDSTSGSSAPHTMMWAGWGGPTIDGLPDGVDYVHLACVDNAGNWSVGGSPSETTVRIDTHAPTVTMVTPADGATYTQGDTYLADYSASDHGLSGVASLSGDVANGAAIDTTSLGSHSFTVTAADVAGNAPTTVTVHYTVKAADTTPPTTTSALTGTTGSNNWYKSAVTVGLTAIDNTGGSGMSGGQAGTWYSFDNKATWTPGTTVTKTADGTYTVWYYSKDAAGNAEAIKSTTFKIDKTPPTVSITKPLTGDFYRRTPTVNSAGTIADVTSGMASQVVTIDGAAATLGGPLNMNVGTHTFKVVATDKAGNVTTVSVPYTVSNTADTTPPTVAITNAQFYDGQSYPVNQPLSIDFTATDSPAGTSLARCSVSATGPSGPITLPSLTQVGTNGATTGIVTALTSASGSYVATIKATDGANNTTTVVVHYSVAGDWGQGLLTQVGGVWQPSPVGDPLKVTVTSTSVVPFEFKLGGEIASVLGGSGALTDLSHARLYIVDPATNKLVYKAPTYFTWSVADQAWKYNFNVSSIWCQIPSGANGRVLREIIVFCDPQGAPKFTSGCGSNATITDLTPVSSDAGVVSNAAASMSASTVAAAPAAAASSSPAAVQALAAAASPSITGLAPTSTSLTSGVATAQVTGANFGSSATGNYVQVSGYSGATHTTSWNQKATISAWSASKIVFKTPANYTGTFNLQVFVGTTGSNVWSNPALTIAAATGSTDIRWIRGG